MPAVTLNRTLLTEIFCDAFTYALSSKLASRSIIWLSFDLNDRVDFFECTDALLLTKDKILKASEWSENSLKLTTV